MDERRARPRLRVLPAAGHRGGRGSPRRNWRSSARNSSTATSPPTTGPRPPTTAQAPARRSTGAASPARPDSCRTSSVSTSSAFDTDRRKLHLRQTIVVSQVAAFELQQFRDTGVLTFATPEVVVRPRLPRPLPAADQNGRAVADRAGAARTGCPRHAVGVGRVPHRRRPRLVRHRHAAPRARDDRLHRADRRHRAVPARARRRDAAPVRGHGRRHRLAAFPAEGSQPVRLPDHRRRPAHHRVHRVGQPRLPPARDRVARPRTSAATARSACATSSPTPGTT